MGHQYIEKRINSTSLNSIHAFADIRGGINQNCKDVYFLCILGVNSSYQKDIAAMDKTLTKKAVQGQAIYNRYLGFPQLAEAQDIQVYSQYYDSWIQSGKKMLFTKNLNSSDGFGEIIGTAFRKVLESYHTYHPNVNTSMEKNFIVKLLFWLDNMGCVFIKDPALDPSRKCVIHNAVKEQEYYFCYLLVLLGIDVLLLQSKRDIDEKAKKLGIAQKIIIGGFQDLELPEYNRNCYFDTENSEDCHCKKEVGNDRDNRIGNTNGYSITKQSGNKDNIQEAKKIVVKIPRHQGHDARAAQRRQAMTPPVNAGYTAQQPAQGGGGYFSANRIPDPTAASGTDLPFEALALRASSIVMIAIHDKSGKIIGSGSGIMVGKDGYILTNNHVTCGAYYSVRIEDDNTSYTTEELIKYNSFLDLAVIRIDRQLVPLPIYQGQKPLVRGQKVVAIGSPLGFFNTVSDGIISGFRQINNVDMIQFTAPISNGSSGGAVLNMQGEVVGIVTLGFDEGQNINLAVGYEFINGFVKGFQ